MAPKEAELQERKDRILAITIQRYIETVVPVSSAYIANESPMDLSSASIRNVLADLEVEGYLTHPHTSAGRIPTEKGYRYFVDHLMHEIQLLEGEKERIRAEYLREKSELESLLEKTSRVLSDTTHYTSIVSVDGSGNKFFCRGMNLVAHYPDFQDLRKIRSILTTLEEKEQILGIINCNLNNRINVLIGHEIHCADMDSCALVISCYKSREGATGRLAVLGPARMNYEKVVSTLHYFSQLIEEI
jgi:transcriptional regulator of heat shock response